MNPPLSIVIPTQDRAHTCVPTVRALLTFTASFELVVYDTSTDSSWQAQLPSDKRLKVVSGSPNQNITECFENAVQLATGDYVCLIGDDDGVTPAIFRLVEEATRIELESVSTHPLSYAFYNWPNVRSKYFGSSVAAKLSIRVAPVEALQRLDLLQTRREFLDGAAQGCGMMPRIYHGLIKRTLLEKMNARFGKRFTGISPDVSFSYLASLCTQSHALTRAPISISGPPPQAMRGAAPCGLTKDRFGPIPT